MNEVVLVGLSHKSASLEMRERCRAGDPAAILAELRELAEEAVVLTTFNRFEVYAHGVADPGRLVEWLAVRAGLPPDGLERHCYVRAGRNACKHLFFVASSLDSLVVGETQIRGQVKAAYRAAEVAERELDRLERRLPDLGGFERERVRRSIHRIVCKLLHMPVAALRESDPGESDVILRAFAPRNDRDAEEG